jgi:hypothetical protein
MPYVLSSSFNSVATDLIVTGNNTCQARVDFIAGFVFAISITTFSVHSYQPPIIKFCSRITTGLYGFIADSTHLLKLKLASIVVKALCYRPEGRGFESR